MSSTKATNANNAATVSVNERVATIPLPFAPLLEEADSNEAAFLLLPTMPVVLQISQRKTTKKPTDPIGN